MSKIPTGKKIYLCTPSLKPITVLNGVDTENASYSEHLRDYSSLTFDVYENIVIDGKQVKSNGYDELDVYMYLYLEDIAYFQMQYPQVQNDGIKEFKSIIAYSIDKEWEDKDWVNFKVNTGEKDSLEQLVEDNTDDLGFTINFIDFYNPDRHDLSLIHIILEKMPNWSVEDEDIDRALWKKKLSFSEDSINLYALMTSVIAPNAECIFVFDCLNRKIKAYSKSNLEFDTNIFVGFRNLASSIEQSVNEDSVFTRFNVAGGNDLTINNWNYNNGRIFNLNYFMHEPYMSEEQIAKFQTWIDWQNAHREEFADLSQKVSDLEAKIYTLKYMLPDDGIKISQWDDMDRKGLEESLKYYNSLLDAFEVSVDENPTYTGSDDRIYHRVCIGSDGKIYHKNEDNKYVDEDGNLAADNITFSYNIVDEDGVIVPSGVTLTYNPWKTDNQGEQVVDYDKYLELLYKMENGKAGYYTYYEIVTYIIPNIEVAIRNLDALTDDDKEEFNKDFETNWELYGSVELEGKLEDYQNKIDALKDKGYDGVPQYKFKIVEETDFDVEDYLKDSFEITELLITTSVKTYNLDDIKSLNNFSSIGFEFSTEEDSNDFDIVIIKNNSDNQLFEEGNTVNFFSCKIRYKRNDVEEYYTYSYGYEDVTYTPIESFGADIQWENGHKKYVEYIGYIGDEETEGSLKWWIKKRESEIDEIGAEERPINLSRMGMVAKVSMYETEILDSDENEYGYDVVELDDPNAEWGFTIDDIKLFHTLMHDTDYTNENILTTSLNTTSTLTSTETIIQKEKELYDDAVEKLSEISQPQITFSVSMDNIMQIKEFEGLREDCSLLRFIRLGVRDDYSVKLRIVGRSWNPCDVTDDFTLEFSNMVSSNSGRSDLTELLNNTSGNAGKNSISLGSGNSDSDKEYAANLLALMVNNGLFASAVQGVAGTGNVDADEVNELIESYLATNLINEASFTKIFSTYIDVEQLVADAIKTATISTDQITDNEGNVFADLVNNSINIGTITTNIIRGQDSEGNYYIDLISGEIAIDKLVSSDGKTALEFINGAVSTDQIVTNIIQGKDGDKNYYINLLEGEIAIDRLVSSDGTTVVDFINGALSTDTITTNLITGKDGNANYYMDLLTGHLNMNTIAANSGFLTNLVAQNAFIENVQSISSSTATSVIDDAYIYNAVANKITVADLAAGDIVLSDQMRILSENDATEGMIMSGSEIQFLDGNGNPSISIGYNTISDGQGGASVDYDHPAIIIKDENGSVMLNSTGLSPTDVGLAPMIQSHSIDEGKLSFDFIKTENGQIIVQNYDGSQNTWGQVITEFISDTNDSLEATIVDTDIYFAVGDSNSIAPQSGWDTNSPQWESGKYIWQKTVTTYGDGTTEETKPVCIQAAKGESNLHVEISSSNGNIFKNDNIATTLTCKVFYGTTDVTNQVSSFNWSKIDKNGNIDQDWNRATASNVISLTNADVEDRASFTCAVEIDI